MSTSAAPREQQSTPGPEILQSGSASLVSIVLAWLLRVTLRPCIAIGAAISALAIRFGPKGIEMWSVWTALLRFTDWDGPLARAPKGTEVERVRLPACDAEFVRAPGVRPDGPVILYFHGGGYVACGIASHRRLAARLSRAAGANVFNVGYRMLPRSAIRLAIEDGVEAYRKLLDDGIASERIVFGGDSAGGGLSFLVAAATRDHGLPMPAGIVALSPWTDFDPEAKLAHHNARRDAVIPVKTVVFIVETLIKEDGALDPTLSPGNLDLTGFPPTLIHAGTEEVLELDARNMADRLAAAGVPVRLKLWQGQVHDFQLIGLDMVPEARQAVTEIGEFVADTVAA
jgi:acetyl esterase/lipase